MEERNGEMQDIRKDLSETGLCYSLAVVLPALLSLVLLLIFMALPEGYEGSEWYKYLNFLLPQVCFAAVALTYFKRGKRTPRAVYSRGKLRYIPIAILLQLALIFSLSELNDLFIGLLGRIGYEPQFDAMLPALDGWNLLPAIFVIALLPAIFEETLFRGILTGGMTAAGWGTAATVLISGALFSLFHHDPEQTLYQAVCGMCFALVAIRSGSVFPTMVAHFINNALILSLTAAGYGSLSASLPFWGYLTLVLCASVVLAGVLGYLVFLDKNNARRGGVREGKTFFVTAAVGIAVCAIEWVMLLIERCV